MRLFTKMKTLEVFIGDKMENCESDLVSYEIQIIESMEPNFSQIHHFLFDFHHRKERTLK